MILATLTDRPNTVRVDLNDIAPSFGTGKVSIPKVGTRLEISPGLSYIEIHYADGNKVQIVDNEYSFFIDPATGAGFVSMLAMYECLDGFIA